MFGEEIDYEEEERRYQEEQQRQLAELEKRNKMFQKKVKVKGNKDEEEEEEPKRQVKSINLDEDEDDNGEAPANNSPAYYDDTDPSEVLQEEDDTDKRASGDVVESYLDSHEEVSKNFKKTSFGDSNRWGKGGELFDHTQLEHGSFLDTYEKDLTNNKKTKMSDSNRWGNYKIPDETELQQGSFLEKQTKHALEEAERQKQLKEQKIQEIKMEKGEVFLDPKTNKFPYAELKSSFPKGVDPVKKELYLSAEEFNKVFGMSVAEYAKLTPFKKKNLKKQLKLF